MPDQHCSTCHWWFDAGAGHEYFGMRHCVFHTGMKTTKAARIHFGGSSPLLTRGYFGCVDWEEDTRKKEE